MVERSSPLFFIESPLALSRDAGLVDRFKETPCGALAALRSLHGEVSVYRRLQPAVGSAIMSRPD
jgi:hypothetical protein